MLRFLSRVRYSRSNSEEDTPSPDELLRDMVEVALDDRWEFTWPNLGEVVGVGIGVDTQCYIPGTNTTLSFGRWSDNRISLWACYLDGCAEPNLRKRAIACLLFPQCSPISRQTSRQHSCKKAEEALD